jgi:protein-S-isoprenylcysteine O-methyltransferase Ste14
MTTDNDRSGSTARLVQLCVGYFAFYTVTGVLVKYFTQLRDPKMSDMAFLFNNTMGGSIFAVGLVVLLGWIKIQSNQLVKRGPFMVPSEIAYIIPSASAPRSSSRPPP